MKSTLVLSVAAAISVTLLSCGDMGEPVWATARGFPYGPFHVPGQVVIGFVDSVNAPFIVSFIDGLHLRPIWIAADSAFSVWIQVDSGTVSEHMARLQQDSALAWVQERGYSGGDPGKTCLLARFNGAVTVGHALALIQSIPGLSWKSTILTPRSALVEVEVGQEEHWVDLLKAYPFVKYADLNRIFYILD
jgi:hypothetical protein